MLNYILIITLAAFPALATDMYLPSLALLQQAWDVEFTVINLSLALFFVSFSFSLLIFGPVADRFGRKPTLYVGITLFIISSVACAMVQNVEQLIVARIIQGCGAASAAALSLTLAKDLFAGNELKRLFAITGIIVPLVPLTAPLLGSWVMVYFSWRIIFIIQAVIALLALIGCIQMQEPPFNRSQYRLHQSLKPYVELTQNRRYFTNLLVFSLGSMPFFMFLAASSSIYIDMFSVSPKNYSWYIGFNAIALMSGAFICSKISQRLSSTSILNIYFIGTWIVASIMLFWHPHHYVFAGLMFCVSLFIGLSRPICNHITLDSITDHVGSATSLLNFTTHILGAIGMYLVSITFHFEIQTIAITSIVGSIAGALYLAASAKQDIQREF